MIGSWDIFFTRALGACEVTFIKVMENIQRPVEDQGLADIVDRYVQGNIMCWQNSRRFLP